jgi:hypothetical protein
MPALVAVRHSAAMRAVTRDGDCPTRRQAPRSCHWGRLIVRFGRVEDFDDKHDDYRNWTFWTCATRAANDFGSIGKPILRQLRRHRALIRLRADKELERAIIRREKRKAA